MDVVYRDLVDQRGSETLLKRSREIRFEVVPRNDFPGTKVKRLELGTEGKEFGDDWEEVRGRNCEDNDPDVFNEKENMRASIDLVNEVEEFWPVELFIIATSATAEDDMRVQMSVYKLGKYG